ncbi:hypothetical protein CCHR01_15472 [Colletotrichum chrysophilum]|uniref:Uncharacterized protein n=1 Tax=Colletotrichum chrysophilum TaxID=1836956 RepID=A0AAD9EAZ1_9PEZI|nr:hypothetical protein CCHR01_15472 [Colletotrichum chrysophilum]
MLVLREIPLGRRRGSANASDLKRSLAASRPGDNHAQQEMMASGEGWRRGDASTCTSTEGPGAPIIK